MDLHVIVGIPSGSTWEADFALSLLGMSLYFASHPVKGYDRHDFTVHNSKGSLLPRARQNIIQNAIDKEATHVLFVDSDQVFPVDTLTRLAEWHKDVVACNVATKTIPASPTARKKNGTSSGEVVFTTEQTLGLERVWRVGTGVMLVKLDIFKDLKKPWFPILWKDDGTECQGEDWSFCSLLEDAKIPVYIDQGLSWEVEHIGNLKYGHQHVVSPKVELVRSPIKIIQT